MEGSLETPPVVITLSIPQAFLQTAGFAAVALLCFLVVIGDPSPGGHFVSGFVAFTLAALWYAWRMLKPDTLTLSPDGLVWQSRLHTTRWAWRDVERFRAIRVHIFSKRVGFDRISGPMGPKTYTQYYVSYAGADDGLGGGWEIPPEALADLLNAARAKWAR